MSLMDVGVMGARWRREAIVMRSMMATSILESFCKNGAACHECFHRERNLACSNLVH